MKPEQAQQLSDYLREFVDAGKAQKGYEFVENVKRTAIDEVFTRLTPEVKDRIKSGMQFQVVDKKNNKHKHSFSKKGQTDSVDTFHSTKKGYGISKEDQSRVQAAMDELVSITRRAIDKLKDLKNNDGTRVYKFDDEDKQVRLQAKLDFTTLIEIEVFSPLVREGLIPENFVIDDYSEVQKLLNNTFQSYRVTTEEERKQDELDLAEMRSNAKGMSGKLDMITGSIDSMKEKLKGHLMQKLTLDKEGLENLQKKAQFTKQGLVMTGSLLKAGITVKKWLPDDDGTPKIVKSQEKLLDPKGYKNTLGDVKDDEGNVVASYSQFDSKGKLLSDDALRMELVQQRRAQAITDVFDMVEDIIGEKLPAELVIKVLDKVVDSDAVFYTKASVEELISIVKDGIVDLAVPGDKITKSRDKLNTLSKEFEAREAAMAAAQELDEKLAKAIGDVAGSSAGEAFEGIFLNELDVNALCKHTAPKASGTDVADTIADAIKAMFAAASPALTEETYEKFVNAGNAIAKAFFDKAPVKDFEKRIKKLPKENPFDDIVKEAVAAVAAAMPKDLILMLEDEETLRKIASKSLIADEEETQAQWDEAENEIKEYEKTLVLLDEGGITAAQERSIERLITEIDKDQATLKLVENLGSTLTGVFGGGMTIVNRISDKVTDVITGEVLGPLKAAKLIMQFAVATKRAADRKRLLEEFKRDLKLSKIAVSSLSSTIQGFVSNKQEQVAFGRIERALLAVQAAAAILGSIPEPHMMAIGKTLSACTSGMKETSEMIEMAYSEKKLKEAWEKTKAALQNPRDRALGLDALRLNPTLGMHAIAWAGMQKTPPDPMARIVLDGVGLNEQTLAVSGTEKKVQQYLKKLLHEDRELIDSAKIHSDWAPEKYSLCAKDWYVITSRAQRDAMPNLSPGNEKPVLEALKKIDKFPIKQLEADVRKGTVPLADLQRRIDETLAVCQALDDYKPLAVDGSAHYEMALIAAEFIKLAAHRKGLLRDLEKNLNVAPPEKVLAMLQGDIEFFQTFFADEEAPPDDTNDKVINKGVSVQVVAKTVKLVRKHMKDVRSRPEIAEQDAIAFELNKLNEYVETAELWMDIEKLRLKDIEEQSQVELVAPNELVVN